MMESIRRDDYGFFGPDSPSWKVWASPTSLIGFQRAVVLEHFDPFLAAAVADSAGIYADPTGRLDRTLAYFLTVAVADGRTAISVSDALMRIHARAKGIEPITGTRYSANNPDAQLWIHVTGWHSVLKCYERYGPGPLSAAEESRFWAESRIAAELQTCKPADVPVSRDEVRQYFADVRGRLCTSEHALPVVDAARPWRAAVGGQQASCAGRDRDAAEMDAAHGQFRPARRGRRRGDTAGPGAGACPVGEQLTPDAGNCARTGAGDRRGAGAAPDRGAAGATAHHHAGRGTRTTGSTRLKLVAS
jgi:uncharacterized protein (DUF2236 family)